MFLFELALIVKILAVSDGNTCNKKGMQKLCNIGST